MVSVPRETLGQRFRRVIDEMGMDAQDLAQLIGRHRNTVGKIVRDEDGVSEEVLRDAAAGLGFTLDEMRRGVRGHTDDGAAHSTREKVGRAARLLVEALEEWGATESPEDGAYRTALESAVQVGRRALRVAERAPGLDYPSPQAEGTETDRGEEGGEEQVAREAGG